MNVMQFLSAQPWVERLGWTLVHFLWQGTLIAALYAIARSWLPVKLHPAAAPEGSYRFSAQSGHASGFSVSMAMFADRLSRPAFQLGRQVVDYTGLKGTFDLALDWKPEGIQGENQPENNSDASIFTAIQEQLGLRLEPRKVALDVLVVDHANKAPTEN